KSPAPATATGAKGDYSYVTMSGSATIDDGGATGERHDTLSEPKGASRHAASEVMVTIYETGADGVSVEKRVPLKDVPPEELGKRLSSLSEERLAGEIRTTEEQIRIAEKEQRNGDLEVHRRRLADLHEIRSLRDGYIAAEKTGGGKHFIEGKRSAFEGKAAALAKVGLLSAMLLLFNELVPDVQLKGASAGSRLRPQGT
ncbi:MAG: hypothetical protein K2X93_00035, partial [Candidatus Obscuribacterales bacterium]|nr:hypothetical protein [Candidatus Obscuribacterales bacterium]